MARTDETAEIHIAIVDNDAMVGRMLGELLAMLDPHMITDYCWRTGEEAVDSCMALLEEGRLPDVLISDLEMPVMGGIDVARAIRHVTSHMGILLITAFTTSQSIEMAAQSGAQGLVYKDSSNEELLDAVRLAAQGLPVDSRFPTCEQSHANLLSQPTATIPALSAMQCTIIRMCADGLSTAEIARMLDIRESSVNEHVKRAMGKFGVHTRAHLIAMCIRKGLI
ncbi:MAG: response regulator transcription factor [Bifidobacterium castoris]|nr:response regulator transcription factor [Bifidobacterium castoris]